MKQYDRSTLVLLGSTIVWALGALWLLWGANLLHLGGRYATLDELDHLGSFLSGFLTPVAVAWAARSLLLQREQMLHAMHVLREERDDQYRQRLEEADPNFQILGGTTILSYGHKMQANFTLVNHGSTARRIRYAYRFIHRMNGSVATQNNLVIAGGLAERGGRYEIQIGFDPNAPLVMTDYDGIVVIHAERLDGRVSSTTFVSQHGSSFELLRKQVAAPGLAFNAVIQFP